MHEKFRKNTIKYIPKNKLIFSKPGETRQKSCFNSLKKLQKNKIKSVLIHDAARPFCSNNLIKRVLFSLKDNLSCVPYVQYPDRQMIKMKSNLTKKNLNIYNL